MQRSIVLAGGCFWCLEAAYQLVNGVISVVPGYTGGKEKDANYESVCSGKTGHAEVVKISYDPDIINLPSIFEIFFTIHDPTTLNRQGNDVGSQYRSAIFYNSEDQKKLATAAIKKYNSYWDNKIVTEINKLDTFYPAEAYHKNYYLNNQNQAYCQQIINPKLQKLRQRLKENLK